jgi:hypothetical protein
MKTETVKEWANRIVAESTPEIPEGTGSTSIFRISPYQQAAFDYIQGMKPNDKIVLATLHHPDTDSPNCVACGVKLDRGGYFINGENYCMNDECVKRGLT